MRLLRPIMLGLVLCFGAARAGAEPMTLDVVLTTTEDISLNFQNDKRHFLTLLLREGTAAGNGVFEGATVANSGLWELAGGTGRFAAQRGTGSLTIGFPSKTERRYVLTGDISPELR